MPIFEYRCRSCGETIEKIQRQPQEEITCSNCGKKAKRVVSLFSAGAGALSGGCSAPGGSGFS